MRFQPTRQSTRRVSCPVINNNQLTVPCVGSVKQGDSVMIIARNGEPVAVAPIGWGDAIEADISDAAQVAAEAQAVAEATGQHFFTDTDGVHVTEAEGDATTGHNILINALGILLRHAANYLTSITASAIAFYDGAGTAASNIVAQFGAALARVGYAAGNHVDVTDGGIDFSMPYDDGNGHTGIVAASMYPEYGSYTNARGYTFTVPVFHITHGTTDLKLYSGGRMAIDSDISAANIDATETIHALDEITVGSLTALAEPCVTLADGTVKMDNRYGSSVLSVNSGGNLDISTPIATDAINGLKAYASGTSGAQNYYALINAATGVGIQFIFNPSTRNLVARYTTNGGSSWSSTKTLATWA